MAEPRRLTKSVIDALAVTERDEIYWDTDLKGFGIKITPKGRKSFLVMYRPKGHHGASKKYTIGTYGEWTTQNARARAREILAESSKGTDVGAVERQEAQKRASNIINDLIDLFIEKHASQNRTGDETKRILKREVAPKIGKRSVHDIRKHDINLILEDITKRGAATMANRTLAAIRKFFNWCVSRGVIDISPVEGIAPHSKEVSRDRVLSLDEVSACMKAAEGIGYPFGVIVQLLFMTAQRRDEVAQMQWNEINLDNALWTLPAERVKNGKVHDVHLSESAVALLRAIPRVLQSDGSPSDYVFTTTGTTPVSGFSKAKSALDTKMLEAMRKRAIENSGNPDNVSLTPWRLHDIRRTVATEMSKLGVPIHITEAILNHKSGMISGVTAVYQRNQFIDERREAMDKWRDCLDAALRSLTPVK